MKKNRAHRWSLIARMTPPVWVVFQLVVLLMLPAHPSWAADPTKGKQLYETPAAPGLLPCADCHGINPQEGGFGFIGTGRNAANLIDRAIRNNTGGMGVFQGLFDQNALEDIAAYLGLSTAALDFGVTRVGNVSAPLQVEILSSLKQPITGLSLDVEGPFEVLASDCLAIVPRFSACGVRIVHRPDAAGEAAGALVVRHEATGTPLRVTLTALATAAERARVSIEPERIDFGGWPGSRRNLMVRNTSELPLTLGSIVIDPPTAVGVLGGSCAQGLVLGAGQACLVALQARVNQDPMGDEGFLRIRHDGEGEGSEVKLGGWAQGQPDDFQTHLLPDSMRFDGVPAGDVSSIAVISLRAPDQADLVWHDAVTTDSSFTVASTDCPAMRRLAAGEACRFGITFRPDDRKQVDAEFQLRNAQGVVLQRVPLSGITPEGQDSREPPAASFEGSIHIDANRLDFGEQTLGSLPTVRQVSIVNRGATDVAWSYVGLTGDHSPAFTLSGDCEPRKVVPPGGACTAEVRFLPMVGGRQHSSLVLWADALEQAIVVTLEGRGVSPSVTTAKLETLDAGMRALAAQGSMSAPLGWWMAKDAPSPDEPRARLVWLDEPLPLTFKATDVGRAALSESRRLVNVGTVDSEPLRWAWVGPDTRAFAVDPSSTCSPGLVLPPGADCVLRWRFTPSHAGAHDARGFVVGAAPVVELPTSGVGVAPVRQSPAVMSGSASLRLQGPEDERLSSMLRLTSSQAAVSVLGRPNVRPPGLVATWDAWSTCGAELVVLLPGERCDFHLAWAGRSAPAMASGRITLEQADGQMVLDLPVAWQEGAQRRSNVGAGAADLSGLLLLIAAAMLGRARQRPTISGASTIRSL